MKRDDLPQPPARGPLLRCPNPDCWALPEPTVVCRMCGTDKIGAAFRRILNGESS